MTPRRYRSSETPNQSVPKLVRLDPSIAATLEASAQQTNISANAIVNDALANYFATTTLGATKFAGMSTTHSSSDLITSSVQNYSETLAVVRDHYQDTISMLSGDTQGKGGTA